MEAIGVVDAGSAGLELKGALEGQFSIRLWLVGLFSGRTYIVAIPADPSGGENAGECKGGSYTEYHQSEVLNCIE